MLVSVGIRLASMTVDFCLSQVGQYVIIENLLFAPGKDGMALRNIQLLGAV